MTSTDLAAAILRACSDRRNLSSEDLYGLFPTVDRCSLEELIHELAESGLLLASVNRSELLDGPVIVVNSISRTSLVGEAWLTQIGGGDSPQVTGCPSPSLH